MKHALRQAEMPLDGGNMGYTGRAECGCLHKQLEVRQKP